MTTTNNNEDVEKKIVEAAKELFIENGFAETSMSDIAAKVGINRPVLHYYFRTKEQLFERILTEKVQLMSESVLAAFGQPGLPLLERLKDGVTCHFDFIAANPQLPRFIVNEVFSRPERYKLMSDKIVKVAGCLMQGIQQELDELHAQGKVDWVDVRMLLLDIISLNVFPFIAYPIIEPVLGDIAADRNRFFELRKAENIEMIMRRIKNNEL